MELRERLLALAGRMKRRSRMANQETGGTVSHRVVAVWANELETIATTLSAREDGCREDADRLGKIRELCGYVENSSEEQFSIAQDDATRTWYAIVGKKSYYGGTFRQAIDAAIAAAPKAPVQLPTFDGGMEVGATSHGKAPTAGEGHGRS